MDCIFCDIRDRKIPKAFTYEDEDLMVFPDIHPMTPVHLLIIPKIHLHDFMQLTDTTIVAKILEVIQKMVTKFDLTNKGYRIVVNGGGAQHVNHLHFHLRGPLQKE